MSGVICHCFSRNRLCLFFFVSLFFPTVTKQISLFFIQLSEDRNLIKLFHVLPIIALAWSDTKFDMFKTIRSEMLSRSFIYFKCKHKTIHSVVFRFLTFWLLGSLPFLLHVILSHSSLPCIQSLWSSPSHVMYIW